jgi:hypothetical protein
MRKISTVSTVIVLALFSVGGTAPARAANVKNGVACSKSGASTVVLVKRVKTTYLCKVNPAAVSYPNLAKGGKTWTLAKCLSNNALLQSQQDNINQALSIANLESEPGKSSDLSMLNSQQATLSKLFADNAANWCKTGL